MQPRRATGCQGAPSATTTTCLISAQRRRALPQLASGRRRRRRQSRRTHPAGIRSAAGPSTTSARTATGTSLPSATGAPSRLVSSGPGVDALPAGQVAGLAQRARHGVHLAWRARPDGRMSAISMMPPPRRRRALSRRSRRRCVRRPPVVGVGRRSSPGRCRDRPRSPSGSWCRPGATLARSPFGIYRPSTFVFGASQEPPFSRVVPDLLKLRPAGLRASLKTKSHASTAISAKKPNDTGTVDPFSHAEEEVGDDPVGDQVGGNGMTDERRRAARREGLREVHPPGRQAEHEAVLLMSAIPAKPRVFCHPA